MKTRKVKIVFGGVGALLLSLILTGVAQGQSLSIGANPAYPKADNPRSANIFILELKPGETAKDGIRISNPTKITRTVNLGAVDTIAAVDGSFSCKQNTEKKTGVGSWIKLDKQQITLAAGQDEVVDFTVTAPLGSGPGEHGGCITFQDTKSYADTSNKSAAGIKLGFRGAVRMAVTVPGEIRKQLSIVRIDTKRNEDGSYMVSPVAKNTGNVSLDVQARAQIRSFFGQKSRVLDDAKYPIMPGASTGWPYRFERPYWGGFYKAYTSLSYNADPTAGIGEHVADQKRTSKISDYFFMIPAPGAIAIYSASILLPLIALFVWLHRRRKKSTIGKKWEKYVVRPGDSLTGLAAERGIKWKRLAKVNGIKPPYGLLIDQELLLPRQGTGRTKDGVSSQQTAERPVSMPAQQDLPAQPSMSTAPHLAQQQPHQPVDPRDIPWPSQEEEYRAWEADRRREYGGVPPLQHHAKGFQNPYHGDEDPAELARDWNGPSQEAIEQHGIVEDATQVPAMHWMWDDLVDEPKKPKRNVKKATKAGQTKRTTAPKSAKKSAPKAKGRTKQKD